MVETIEDDILTEGLRTEYTAREVFINRVRHFLKRIWRVMRSALLIIPLLFLAVVTMDLPFRWFDGFAGEMYHLAASNWFSWGAIFMSLIMPAAMIVARRFGYIVATRTVTLAWLVVFLMVVGVLLVLAPQISRTDFPSSRYLWAFAISWYIGQVVCIFVYELTRGGKWWRAPLYGALIGFGLQSVIFIMIAYSTFDVPWIHWIVMDYFIKAVIATLALLPYHWLRRSVRPDMGLGGL